MPQKPCKINNPINRKTTNCIASPSLIGMVVTSTVTSSSEVKNYSIVPHLPHSGRKAIKAFLSLFYVLQSEPIVYNCLLLRVL